MILLSTSIAIADLCGEVPAAETPDVADSAAYTAVGDDARASDPRVAAIAYRQALALDPRNAHAREALTGLCHVAPGEGDALLAAIARFREGDLDAAERLLQPIADGGAQNAAGAHFFLALIALARHDGAARDDLAAASQDPAYAGLARSLARLARRQGRFEAILLVAPELDTNPQLLPDTPPAGATTGPARADEDLLLAASGAARPTRWLIVRDAVTWRAQRDLPALDYLGNTTQVEVVLPLGADRVAVRYDLDYDRLDGASYLVAHRGTVSYRHELGDLSLVAEYGVRRRDYLEAAQDPFTGWVHGGDAGAIAHLGRDVDLDLRATIWRELTADPAFADVAVGTVAVVHVRPRDGIRFSGAASAWYARYDAANPDGELRDDVHGELAADLEVDLGDHLLAIAGASLAGNQSSIDDFRYWKLTARVGLAFAIGGP